MRPGAKLQGTGYMPKIISTIVDTIGNRENRKGLYAKNNFYYCRLCGELKYLIWLYAKNNFYYCR